MILNILFELRIDSIEKKYYADGEDAYVMKLLLG